MRVGKVDAQNEDEDEKNGENEFLNSPNQN